MNDYLFLLGLRLRYFFKGIGLTDPEAKINNLKKDEIKGRMTVGALGLSIVAIFDLVTDYLFLFEQFADDRMNGGENGEDRVCQSLTYTLCFTTGGEDVFEQLADDVKMNGGKDGEDRVYQALTYILCFTTGIGTIMWYLSTFEFILPYSSTFFLQKTPDGKSAPRWRLTVINLFFEDFFEIVISAILTSRVEDDRPNTFFANLIASIFGILFKAISSIESREEIPLMEMLAMLHDTDGQANILRTYKSNKKEVEVDKFASRKIFPKLQKGTPYQYLDLDFSFSSKTNRATKLLRSIFPGTFSSRELNQVPRVVVQMIRSGTRYSKLNFNGNYFGTLESMKDVVNFCVTFAEEENKKSEKPMEERRFMDDDHRCQEFGFSNCFCPKDEDSDSTVQLILIQLTKFLKALTGIQNLKKIDLSHNKFGEWFKKEGVDGNLSSVFLAATESCKHLKEIDMTGNFGNIHDPLTEQKRSATLWLGKHSNLEENVYPKFTATISEDKRLKLEREITTPYGRIRRYDDDDEEKNDESDSNSSGSKSKSKSVRKNDSQSDSKSKSDSKD